MEKAMLIPVLRSPQNLDLMGPRRDDPDFPFTEAELAVAEHLIHLSESTGPTVSANFMASASASSSTRSVNAPARGPAEDDEGLWRRNKRYRPIADVYASTVPFGDRGGGEKASRKRKGSNGRRGERV